MPMSNDQAIACGVRIQTALWATNEALHTATAEDGTELNHVIVTRLRDSLATLRMAKQQCDKIIGPVMALIDG